MTDYNAAAVIPGFSANLATTTTPSSVTYNGTTYYDDGPDNATPMPGLKVKTPGYIDMPNAGVTALANYMLKIPTNTRQGGSTELQLAKSWTSGDTSNNTKYLIVNSANVILTLGKVSNSILPDPAQILPGLNAGINAGKSVFNTFGSVAEFLSTLWATLTSKEFWLKALEFVGGGILIGLGVAHLSGQQNVVSRFAGAVDPSRPFKH